MIKNMIGHLKVVLHHKWEVFKLACKVGIPGRGLLHDLSKFSPTEFINGAKYYAGGVKSPINIEKANIGYSKAWLHHKGRNKHHPEYWYDEGAENAMPIMPFCYVCEMICDQLAAGKVYQKSQWTKEYQLQYWRKQREKIQLNEALKQMLDKVYEEVADKGIKETITKQNLKNWYNQYTQKEVEISSQKN